MQDFNLDKLIKAKNVFEEFRQNMEAHRDKAGAIQAFKEKIEKDLIQL